MPRKTRVLFIADAVTLAHVARATVLAHTLDLSEFEVHVAWDPRYDHLLGPLPFRRHQIWSLPTEEFLRRVASGRPLHDVQMLRRYVHEDLEVLRRVDPDLVVSDFRISLVASARLARKPLMTVANAYWSPFGRQSFLFDAYEYPLSGLVGDGAARLLFRAFKSAGFAAHTRPLNRVLKEHGLAPIGGDIRTMYTAGDLTAYADIPALFPDLVLPPSHRFIGAAIWSPPLERPSWWRELPEDRPIVYVTLGSSGDPTALEVVFRALAEEPLSVIAATAGRREFASLPANVRASLFLPGAEAAARAALVISNGGSPTTYQALAAGVPVLALTSNNMDQHLNMEAVCRAGAGRMMRASGLRAAELGGVVREMLAGHGYTAAAHRLSAAHADSPAGVAFPALVNEVSRLGGP